MKLFKFELMRMIRSRILQLSILLLILIGIIGVVLCNVYYEPQNDARYILLSLYNSYTQFTYLVLSYVFVSVFCKDFQNGVYAWFKQLGYSFRCVCFTKLLVLLLTMLPLLNVFFLGGQIFSGNQDFEYYVLCTVSVNLGVIYIIVLSLFISIVLKNVIHSTLIMYGLFIVFNGINLVCYGMINPSDSNSISSYYLNKIINPSQGHYSLSKVSWSESTLLLISILLPLMWIIVLLTASIFLKRQRKE